MSLLSKHFDDFFKIMTGKFNYSRLILPILTAIGALGGFPSGPRTFKNITRNKFFQYFFLFILIIQGGGRVEIDISIIVVIVFFVINESIIAIENRIYGPDPDLDLNIHNSR